MINITNKENCCGCEACVQVCPKHCIEFKPDSMGFFYPLVNEDKCVNCGMCNKVCPILNAGHNKLSAQTPVFAAYNKDDNQRKTSSSGGIFELLALETIKNKGVVFGAVFDRNWRVLHSYAETQEQIESLKRSKYVQSRIGTSYIKVKKNLKAGRQVLFVGTPCQIAGLKNYLRKDYSNLITVDVVCHGVPSPMIWKKYLSERKAKIAHEYNSSDDDVWLDSISFRDKSESWRRFHLSLTYKVRKDGIDAIGADSMLRNSSTYIWEDSYMLSFLQDFINRPSCFDCKFRNGNCHSDITLADFWCIEKWTDLEDFSGDEGTSMILIHTSKGKEFFNRLEAKRIQMTLQKAVYGNPALLRSWPKPKVHDLYFLLCRFFSVSSTYKIAYKLQGIFNSIFSLKAKIKSLK